MKLPQIGWDVIGVIIARWMIDLGSWVLLALIGTPITDLIRKRIRRDKVKVAMFEHYAFEHPPKNPRVCDIGLCQLVPPKQPRFAEFRAELAHHLKYPKGLHSPQPARPRSTAQPGEPLSYSTRSDTAAGSQPKLGNQPNQ